MARSSSEDKVGEQELAELEDIGESLQSRTPAERVSQPLDKKLEELWREQPDLVKEKYRRPIEDYLGGFCTQKEAAEMAGVARATFQRQLKRVEHALEAFHVETGELQEQEIVLVDPFELDIDKYQPRETGTQPSDELWADIQDTGGNRTPIRVRRNEEGKLEVIGGHLRVKALRLINVDANENLKARCIIEPSTPKVAALDALRDNMMQRGLESHERNAYIAELVNDYGWSPSELSDALPKEMKTSPENISNIARAFRDSILELRTMLKEGTLSIGHVKAIVSLDEDLQKRLHQFIKDKMRAAKNRGELHVTPSTREVEEYAARLRDEERVLKVLRDALKDMADEKNEILLEDELSDLLIDIEPPAGWTGDYVPEPHDLLAAANDIGVKFVRPPEPESAHVEDVETDERVESETDAIKPKDAKVEPKKEEKPKPACWLCRLFNHRKELCALGLDAPRMECDQRIPGIPLDDVKLCPFCGGLTTFVTDGPDFYIETHRVRGERINHLGEHADPDLTYVVHTHCLTQALVSKFLIEGKCKTCMNAQCEFLDVLESMEIDATIHVDACLEYDDADDIEAMNKRVLEHLHELQSQEDTA
jgi:ParB-like chromosome segregation protein Spo0J